MNLPLLLFPVAILMFACCGLGLVLCRILRNYLPPMPIWVIFTVTYFLGQGVLASIFELLAIKGWFFNWLIWIISLVFAILAIIWVVANRLQWRSFFQAASLRWLQAPFSWKILSLGLGILLLAGVTTLGSWFVIDGLAFYMAIAKLMAGTGRLIPLPGLYEAFSSVGLLAETLTAALMSMGMPNNSAKILSWANYLPTTVILYAIARQCKVSRRGALLSVIMATTSSAAVLLWGSGKTDLFALGPALAAVFCALQTQDARSRKGALGLSGVLAGFAFVFKLSYIVVLVPVLALIIGWPYIFEAWALVQRKEIEKIKGILRLVLIDALIYGVAIAIAMLPHFMKNLLLLDTVIGATYYSGWYSSKTIARILLSYPLALTYGNYWAQFGTISPLILAFIPLILYLKKPVDFKNNQLFCLSIGALLGLLLWMILFPSIFMPRYILVVLVLCAIAPAAAAAKVCSSHKTLSVLILLSILATMIYTPKATNRIFKSFDSRLALNYPMCKDREHLTAQPSEDYYWAFEAVNNVAPQNSKVLLLTYARFWLRADLLLNDVYSTEDCPVSVNDERSAGNFWSYILKNNISYVVIDTTAFNQVSIKDLKDAANARNLKIKVLFENDSLVALEILHDK